MSSDSPPADDDAPPPRYGRWWRWVAAFVVGIVVGGVVVAVAGLGGTTNDNFSNGVTPTLTPTGTATPQSTAAALSPAPSGAGGGRVLIDASCLQAINRAQDIYNATTDLATAARQLDANRLDQIVRRLGVIEPQLRQALGACHATVQAPSTTPTAASATGPPAPSAAG